VPEPTLAGRIDAALPQTQCMRCGYDDCRAYAQAIAEGQAAINRCPPGGAQGIVRLAAITGHDVLALDASCGAEGPRQRMFIDEAWCIGCTLCLDACPVDCIVGASKQMHTVIEDLCTGCELCLPACPVDCILVEPATPGRGGWDAWSAPQAEQARMRYAMHRAHRAPAEAPAPPDTGDSPAERRQAVIDAALQRARERAPRSA
jgi:Na+-translocating ferredoxin:NAD+ oxidoreductase subunit B